MATGIFAGIPVDDFPSALEWYERLLGTPPAFHPHDTEAVWQLAEDRYVYVVRDVERAGGAVCMIWVDDPVAEARRIAERGLEPVDLEKHEGVWKYVFHDADGNEIGIGGEVRSSGTQPAQSYDTAVVFMLGYPGMGKRTIGGHLATLLDGVLVDNALINRPLLELFRWDGVEPLPPEIWQRAGRIREAVLGTIEDLAPASNSYVFTNVIEEGPQASDHYDELRSLAARRGSLFLAVMLSCDIDVQVSRIDNPDRVALRKGSDPEGYRGHRLTTRLFQPPAADVLHLDTTETPAEVNAATIHRELVRRGLRPPTT